MSLDMLHKVAEEGLKKELQQLGFDMSGEVSGPVARIILAVVHI